MMNQESLLAVLETLGDGIAARKNFEENQREHCEQLYEQNQLLMKELKGLRAENEELKANLKELLSAPSDTACARGCRPEDEYANACEYDGGCDVCAAE